MKRTLLLILCALFALSSISLVCIQLLQTQRSATISSNLFSINVGNAMEDVITQINRLKVEDYINQKDRYKLLKYKRMEELTGRMLDLVQSNTALFYDEERVSFGTVLQDSAFILQSTQIGDDEYELIQRYNQLLLNRNNLIGDESYYDRFVSDISEYIFDNVLANSNFNYPLLDSLIYENLLLEGIDIRPTVGVLNSTADTFLYTSPGAHTDKLRTSPYHYSLHPDNNLQANDYFILLQFPYSSLILQEHANLYLILSFLLMGIIVLSFILTSRMIFNLNKADQVKNDFISNMTHEIKTPLATINLACEMLRDKSIVTDSASQETYLGIIQNENHRMQVLVESILQSSKMSNKKFTITPVKINLHQVIDKVVEGFQIQAENRQGTIQVSLQANTDSIYADELHITNAIYNLVDNALKYSPERPDIRISTRNDKNNLILQVQDHGLGISKENQKHIFEKFYRVTTGDVHDVKGFGLGLNYVKQVLDLHHSTVHIDSKLGKGTTFTITFPTI